MPRTVTPKRKPEWIRTKIPRGKGFSAISSTNQSLGLSTICEEAKCPNQWECWKEGTATFLLMGDTCTRACRFCSVKTSKHPPALDQEEPLKLVQSIKSLKLKYVVLTSVDRDDLPDYGATHLSNCVKVIKNHNPNLIVELLIPDLQMNTNCVDIVVKSGAEVIGHNLECTKELTAKVRDPRAGYSSSLEVLRMIKQSNPEVITKSSIMLGLGESEEDIINTLSDIRDTGVEILTIGQYLQPNRYKLSVEEYIHPSKFDEIGALAKNMGFSFVASGPLVRSSYHAAEHYLKYRLKREKDLAV